jgi:hypothetical protein
LPVYGQTKPIIFSSKTAWFFPGIPTAENFRAYAGKLKKE